MHINAIRIVPVVTASQSNQNARKSKTFQRKNTIYYFRAIFLENYLSFTDAVVFCRLTQEPALKMWIIGVADHCCDMHGSRFHLLRARARALRRCKHIFAAYVIIQ